MIITAMAGLHPQKVRGEEDIGTGIVRATGRLLMGVKAEAKAQAEVHEEADHPIMEDLQAEK